MKIKVNTDKNFKGTQDFEVYVEEKVGKLLQRFADKITRVEIHFSDQNAQKNTPDDVYCTIEARVDGLSPVAVTGKSSTREKALSDAVKKIKAALDTVIGKLKKK